MAFKTIPMGGPKHVLCPDSGTIAVYIQQKRPCCNLTFGVTLVNRLGWRPGQRVALQVGDGPNQGKLRIVPQEKEGRKLFSAGDSAALKLRFPVLPGMDPRYRAAKVFVSAASGNVLTIELPEWARGARIEE